MPSANLYSILLKKENAHEDNIYCCAWTRIKVSNDSIKDFIVTGGLDSLVKVWQLHNNRLELIHTLEGHMMAVVSVAISPDGHTLATTSLDSSLIIWDLLSGIQVHEVQTGPVDVWKVVFSPDGTQVVSGGHMGKLTVYGIEKGSTEKILDTRGKFSASVAWSPDGSYIASGSVDGTVCIFDVAQGKLVHTIEAHIQTVSCLAFSPNSQLIATGSHDENLKVYNVASASLIGKSKCDSWITGVCFSGDGTRVATASSDGTVRVQMLERLKVVASFKEHTENVCDIQFNAAGNQLMSVSKDKCINIYECPLPPKNKK